MQDTLHRPVRQAGSYTEQLQVPMSFDLELLGSRKGAELTEAGPFSLPQAMARLDKGPWSLATMNLLNSVSPTDVYV